MFRKKAQIKPYAPLRSSDRRKIAQSIIDEFKPTPPPSEDRDAVVVALRNSLVPENTTSAKFTTNLGPDLDQVGGVIYVGSPPGEQPKPLWIKVDGTVFPTVYTLWRNPSILPLLHTHPPVIDKLYTGADLMIPGLIGPPFPEDARKGHLVAIASSYNPTVALAVGVAEIDISMLSKVAGERGKAVKILHWFGDELGGSGEKPPEVVEGVSMENAMDGEEFGGVSLEGLSLSDGNKGCLDTQAIPADRELTMKETDTTSQLHHYLDKGTHTYIEPGPLKVKEIDAAFLEAFVFGIYHHQNKGTHANIEYPITQSAFMTTLVLPFLPPASHFDPDTGSMSTIHPSLQIKKTSWKNTAKFLKHLEKEQFLRTKTRQGNELVVLEIDWDDDRVNSFVPYKLPVSPVPISSSTTGGHDGAAAKGPLKVLELYKPGQKVYPILEAVKANVKDMYTPQDLKDLFNAYLNAESESHPTNKRLVKINPVIANCLLNPSVPEDANNISQGTAKRDVLAQRFIKACSPYYLVLRPGETYPDGINMKPSAGMPPKVTVTMEKKRGKVMTKISGLEAFRIDPGVLAEELRTLCASSASVSQIIGSSPKHPLMEITVQGPQDKIIRGVLEEKGLPNKCTVVVDNLSSNRRNK